MDASSTKTILGWSTKTAQWCQSIFFNDLFFLPYVTPHTPTDKSRSSGSYAPYSANRVDEAALLASTILAYNANTNDPKEAAVRLDARPFLDKTINIDTQLSDRSVDKTEDDQNRIVHHALGHIDHKKLAATSAVVDGMPKYSKHNTWCSTKPLVDLYF